MLYWHEIMEMCGRGSRFTGNLPADRDSLALADELALYRAYEINPAETTPGRRDATNEVLPHRHSLAPRLSAANYF